jgi:hypothetical protein
MPMAKAIAWRYWLNGWNASKLVFCLTDCIQGVNLYPASQYPLICKSIKEKLRMSKIIKMTLVAAAIFSLSSCAAYNSIMPDWATGSESAESQDEGSDNSDAGDDVKWWNPITWF